MAGLSSNEVAEMLGWPLSRVYDFINDGLISPAREGRSYRFDFRDLVVLRSAQQLLLEQVSPTQVRAALKELRARLPSGKSLSASRLAARGRAVAVQEGATLWELDTGQGALDFLNPTGGSEKPPGGSELPAPADEWFTIGSRVEDSDPERAVYAYQRATELDPDHADAHTNLGYLRQQAGQLKPALESYHQALRASPDHVIARFNLATVQEDLGQFEEALDAYSIAAEELPDARYNRARLLEQLGRQQEALAELKELMKTRSRKPQ